MPRYLLTSRNRRGQWSMLKLVKTYLRDIFKPSIAITEPPSSTWDDILKSKKQTSARRFKPSRRIIYRNMYLPSNSVFMWKSPEPLKPNKGAQPGMNILFKFNYNDTMIVINSKRPLNQTLKEGLEKVRFNMVKKVTSSAKKSTPIDEASISFESNDVGNDDETFANCGEFQTFHVNGNEFRVIPLCPPLSSVTLNTHPIVGSLMCPVVHFNEECQETSSYGEPRFHWFVQKRERKKNSSLELDCNEDEWKFKIDGFEYKTSASFYEPMLDDVGKRLAVIAEFGTNFPAYGFESKLVVSNEPSELVTDEQVAWCRKNLMNGTETDRIRVMSYNMLANLYLNLSLPQEQLYFSYCGKEYQSFDYRLPLLMKQIKDFARNGVSLMFLQEVDRNKLHYYRKLFAHIEYEMIFSKKGQLVEEGCLLAFDRRRFELLEEKTFVMADLMKNEENEDLHEILNASQTVKDRVLTRPTILQIVTLLDTISNKVLLCSNTHLHHDPAEEYIKLLQALVAIRMIHKRVTEIRDSGKEVGMIFGGDFNSVPCGAVFELYTKGKVSRNHECWSKPNDGIAQDLKIPNEMEIRLLSGKPEYTNYTKSMGNNGFIGCLDYLWATGCSPLRSCPMPSHEKVIKFGAIPSKISPSDHLPIIVDVNIKN